MPSTDVTASWGGKTGSRISDSYPLAGATVAQASPTAYTSSSVTPSATITNDTTAHLSQVVAQIVKDLARMGLATNTP